MRNLAIPIFLFGCFMTISSCEQSYPVSNSLTEDEGSNRTPINNEVNSYVNRPLPYNYVLGRRAAYTYTSNGNGIKRLPLYNFGLGKRSRLYDFGLGKRSDEYDDNYPDDASNENSPIKSFDRQRLYEILSAISPYNNHKRGKSYSFGLGKRETDDGLERRSAPQRYNFGLGKR